MDRQYDFAALEALLKKRSFKALREALLELNEVDIAEFLGLLNGEEAVLAFRTLPKGVAADVFAELEPEMQSSSSLRRRMRNWPSSWRTCTWTTRWICWRTCPPMWSSAS